MPISNLPHREEYLRKKRKRRIIRVSIALVSFIAFVALVSYVSHRKELRINRVNLFGGVLITEDEIQKETFKYLDGKYFYLFPRNNALIYPKSKLEDYLKSTFKRIDNIDISQKGFQRLSITISERKHFAVWCKGLPGLDTLEEECYFMDKNSTIFAPAPNFSGDAYFKYYGSIQNASPVGQEYMASSTLFFDISNFVKSVKELSLKPLYVQSKGNDEFVIKLSGGGEILFDTKDSLSKVAENLNLLLKTPELSKFDKSTLPVEYIDLRFGNKLFYKLKSE